jgi:hypothetical protein
MTIKNTADTVGAQARAFDTSGPLVFVRHLTDEDVYVRESPAGNVLVVMPGLWTTMPDTLLAALRARRAANATGRCPACDGVADLPVTGIAHENTCPAIDDAIGPALYAWGRQVGRYARGRRIAEDPA